mmetsp:Transcript_2990/g.8160  ORF Transcript_2990/g.8160 Transcript_2990/m.8160 type:complete len:254 (+) Transcript_2990:986-1747(+)
MQEVLWLFKSPKGIHQHQAVAAVHEAPNPVGHDAKIHHVEPPQHPKHIKAGVGNEQTTSRNPEAAVVDIDNGPEKVLKNDEITGEVDHEGDVPGSRVFLSGKSEHVADNNVRAKFIECLLDRVLGDIGQGAKDSLLAFPGGSLHRLVGIEAFSDGQRHELDTGGLAAGFGFLGSMGKCDEANLVLAITVVVVAIATLIGSIAFCKALGKAQHRIQVPGIGRGTASDLQPSRLRSGVIEVVRRCLDCCRHNKSD